MLVKSVSILPTSLKSMDPMQNYPQNIDLFDCTRNMLGIMFLRPINLLIFSERWSTPKLSK